MKLVKPQNDTYIDSTGIVHNKKKLNEELENKVDKVDGKGLSTEDYTTDEKNNLNNITKIMNNTLTFKEVDGFLLRDNSSKTINLDNTFSYFFINSHVFQPSIYLVQNFINAGFSAQLIGGKDTIKFTKNIDNSITITSSNQCIGHLYKTNIGTFV